MPGLHELARELVLVGHHEPMFLLGAFFMLVTPPDHKDRFFHSTDSHTNWALTNSNGAH
jgi:hypothetical protein